MAFRFKDQNFEKVALSLTLLVFVLLFVAFYFGLAKDGQVIFKEVRFWQIAADSVVVISPNATGTVTNIDNTGPTADLAHWEMVDEYPTEDDLNTYVHNTTKNATQYDVYGLADPGKTGDINSVTVTIRAFGDKAGSSVKTVLLTEGGTYYSGSYVLPAVDTWYTTSSSPYSTNPSTTAAWTWTQINDLEAGVELTTPNTGGADMYSTQVYVSVDYTSANQTPSVSSVDLNGGSTITLTENTTTTVDCGATITDNDGWDTIASATAKIYRSSTTAGYACSTDNNNCYSVSPCTLGSTTTYTRDTTCTSYMWFFADPTDASSTDYSAQTWACDVTGWDDQDAFATNTDLTPPELATQYAIDIEGTIDYGTLDVNESSTVQTTRATTTGNAAIGLNLYGVAMETSTYSIGVGQQEWASSTFTHSDATGVDLGASPGADYAFDLPKPLSATFSSTTVYWNILIPSLQAPGIYEGTNTISAVKPPS